ncbi:MAG: hypothetical protein BroJett012_06720 [Betaproteobacteria bacterium]|nr:MAG: hypothetical protein BroJett012_06720 [Betaproteobacteria bacterium]
MAESISLRLKIAMGLMEDAIGFDAIGKYNLTPLAGETIFEAMVRQGVAKSLYEAAMKVGKEIPPPKGDSWNSLAAWVEDYLKEEARLSRTAVSPARATL